MLSSVIRRQIIPRIPRSMGHVLGAKKGSGVTEAALHPRGALVAPTYLQSPFSTKSTTTKAPKKAPPKAAAAAPPPPPPPPKKASSPPPPPPPTLASRLAALSEELPHMDAVRYAHKNRTWTFRHVHYYSEALAVGLVENGFQTGDVVLSLLPSHLSEQMVLQFACSKAGLVLYALDTAPMAAKDAGLATAAIEAALTASKANILVSLEADEHANHITLVQSVVPELRIYDASSGLPFVTPRFPSLRMCIHTGFDQNDKYGWLPLRQMVVPSDNLAAYVPTPPSPATPLAGTFALDAKGIPTGIGPTLTNEQVGSSSGTWPTVASILNKQYQTVEGVGVVF